MPFDAFFLARGGKIDVFFLPDATNRRKSVFWAVEVVLHFAFLTTFFQHGTNDDHRKEKDNNAGRHWKCNRDADNEQQPANDAAANKGRKTTKHDNSKHDGKQDGGDLIHKGSSLVSDHGRVLTLAIVAGC